jgi:hypothetical protein
VFLAGDTINGANVTITGSQILGSLQLNNSTVTLVGVSGGNISASHSVVDLRDSSVDGLSLVSSKVTLSDSSYASVSPPLPSIQVAGLDKPISSVASFDVTVAGAGLTVGSLSANIDGTSANLSVNATSAGLRATGRIDPAAINDGVHTLTLTAAQSDGLSSTLSTSFSTNAHQQALNNETSALLYVAMALAAVAVVALVIAAVAYRRTVARAVPSAPSAPQV